MAEVRVVRQAELLRLGLPAPCDRVEMLVTVDELVRLKHHYSKSKGCRVIISSADELLVRFPGNVAECLYYW